MSNVYFLVMHESSQPSHDFGFVKVGITDGDVAARIASLQTGNPHELRCVRSFETSCAREVEHYIHRTHATEMHNREWLACHTAAISALFEEAQVAARRFEDRKAQVDAVRDRESNGRTRRADLGEMALHREVRNLKKVLVPATLRLIAAENQLRMATGRTYGIRGIVRVKKTKETDRFSLAVAEIKFPELTSRCRVPEVGGHFHWRRMPMPSHFVTENLLAKEAVAKARESVDTVLTENAHLEGWIEPTAEMKRLHDAFLRETEEVNDLEAHLADFESEFTVRLGDFDELDPVCSFKRHQTQEVDVAAFRKTYPKEAAECTETVAPQIRKHVYPTRSYL